ncbi:MAG: thiamine pyrophosphate-binding protein [Coriobacteriia bacterium]|nr:thiamine pyrophosphate-binding protein [Coriobacteriia bacterium]
MQINGATALIRALEDLGVKRIFGIPGVQNIEIYDALLASHIEHVLVRHEQAAVHMADGYARATGGVGVVFATSGPGATNTVTGIATAYMDSVPVIVITGQVHTTSIGTDAFQEADITTITLPITKHSYLLKDVDALVPAVFEAFYLATSGRPGPVLIDIPGNVAAAETSYHKPSAAPTLPSYKPTIKGNARQVKAAAELIAAAKWPVLLAGGGVVSSNASKEVLALAEQAQIPVVTTLMAKGVLAAAHPLLLGQPGVYGTPQANAALHEADLIIAVGTRFSERATADADHYAPRAKIVHIDIDPAEIGKNIRVDVPIVGDAATVLGALSERLEKTRRPVLQEGESLAATSLPSSSSSPEAPPGVSAEVPVEAPAKAPAEAPAEAPAKAPANNGLYLNTTHRVFSVFNELLKACEDVIITTDVGQHQLWASHLLDASKPRKFLTSGGLGTMGFGMPAAIGAQLAFPESLVVCISGDGSFQMNVQEMATAVDLKLPIKVAIINNHSLGLVRQWQELFLEHRFSHTLLANTPDYVKLAEAYQWQGRRIDTKGEANNLKDNLRWLLKSEGPALLEIVVPTPDLVEPMIKPGGTLTELV